MTEKQLLINEMFKLVSILEHNGDFIFEQFGLTVKTYGLLYMISTGINTSRDLLNGTYGSKPNMTKKIKSLEEGGFIFREVDNQDKRVWRFFLSHKSIKIMEDIHPIYEKGIECMFENISKSELSLTIKNYYSNTSYSGKNEMGKLKILFFKKNHIIRFNIFGIVFFMSFKMINESFVCENCGQNIEKHPEGSARNHCPFCLFSKHLDKDFPGDRASECGGLMMPVGVDHKKNKGWMISHKCQKCGKTILNKVAPDDKFVEFVQKLNKIKYFFLTNIIFSLFLFCKIYKKEIYFAKK